MSEKIVVNDCPCGGKVNFIQQFKEPSGYPDDEGYYSYALKCDKCHFGSEYLVGIEGKKSLARRWNVIVAK